jgi:hypothetical protein
MLGVRPQRGNSDTLKIIPSLKNFCQEFWRLIFPIMGSVESRVVLKAYRLFAEDS